VEYMYFQQITSFATTVTVITAFRSVTKKNLRGRVRMGVKSAGAGGDGTKIPSRFTPLVVRCERCSVLPPTERVANSKNVKVWFHVQQK